MTINMTNSPCVTFEINLRMSWGNFRWPNDGLRLNKIARNLFLFGFRSVSEWGGVVRRGHNNNNNQNLNLIITTQHSLLPCVDHEWYFSSFWDVQFRLPKPKKYVFRKCTVTYYVYSKMFVKVYKANVHE